METRTHCTEKTGNTVQNLSYTFVRSQTYVRRWRHTFVKISSNTENAMCKYGNKGATHLNSLRASKDRRLLRRMQSMNGVKDIMLNARVRNQNTEKKNWTLSMIFLEYSQNSFNDSRRTDRNEESNFYLKSHYSGAHAYDTPNACRAIHCVLRFKSIDACSEYIYNIYG